MFKSRQMNKLSKCNFRSVSVCVCVCTRWPVENSRVLFLNSFVRPGASFSNGSTLPCNKNNLLAVFYTSLETKLCNSDGSNAFLFLFSAHLLFKGKSLNFTKLYIYVPYQAFSFFVQFRSRSYFPERY